MQLRSGEQTILWILQSNRLIQQRSQDSSVSGGGGGGGGGGRTPLRSTAIRSFEFLLAYVVSFMSYIKVSFNISTIQCMFNNF
jgi:hypothetical protein